MKKIWSDIAWKEYLFWQENDKKTLKKINKLLKSVERDGPLLGEGKPELLKGNFQDCISRRIDERNRLIYRMNDLGIEIISCSGHYEDN